ncbi:MAG: M15 family metallopeptidase [Bacteroidia bacterium]
MKQLSKEELLGQFTPEAHPRFSEIISTVDSEPMFLRDEAAAAWNQMVKAAKPDGIELKAVSATRCFNRQKQIWERKWTGETRVNEINADEFEAFSSLQKATAIMKYSAMPGTSRHHWGTDLDINSVEPEYFETPEGKNIFIWLKVNAGRFGFGMPYSSRSEGRLLGYEEEKWHWSFLPQSRDILHRYLSMISYDDIIGFKGCETAQALRVISNYVLAISHSCR